MEELGILCVWGKGGIEGDEGAFVSCWFPFVTLPLQCVALLAFGGGGDLHVRLWLHILCRVLWLSHMVVDSSSCLASL